MKLICAACERPIWLHSDDLEGLAVDGRNDLVRPFCGARQLTAAAPEEERHEREDRADWGVYG